VVGGEDPHRPVDRQTNAEGEQHRPLPQPVPLLLEDSRTEDVGTDEEQSDPMRNITGISPRPPMKPTTRSWTIAQ